ncbi:MAG: LytTR family DNA-binding domain-containing protein [Bacteroidia bacterium]|nr:LytTR family DNA-binding domain-containing protein [Bacteroidia bacterium]MDW8348530.1 LytTR family DNA-binding domain-containing protein [Bacteroidia bacterium]
MIHVIIADDELPAREKMSYMLKNIPNITIDAVAKNGIEALQAIISYKPHLAFLDIQMPGLSGIEVAEHIPQDIPTKVVFTTAYQEYAIKAFEVNAVDYLLKPFNAERLQSAIHKSGLRDEKENYNIQKLKQDFKQQTELKFSEKIPVTHRDKIKLIDYEDITLIKVDGRGCYLFTAEGSYYIHQSLEYFEQRLPEKDFLRVNRAEIINLRQIKELVIWFSNRYKVILNDTNEVLCSRDKSKVIKKVLNLNHKDI